MKVLKGIVIIIYIILGASFGIMLIPEILNDLGMNTPPIYTNQLERIQSSLLNHQYND
jgi:uncharacterized protein YacL